MSKSRYSLAVQGLYGHDFYTSVATAAATDTFCVIEAWGEAAEVSYDVLIPGTNTSESRTTTIELGQRIMGRISNLAVSTGEVIAYNYPA